ncbi:MAG TPA: hypothetical protein ENI42_03335 [Thermoplasmatales archaeon]|nr:hypothetical protein [Thermoplasmatales archaeon]
MSLDKLIAQIEEDANQEIDRIIGEAKEEVRRKLEETGRKAKEEALLLKQHAEKEFENMKRSELSKVRQEVRRRVLERKEDIINECFRKALERFKNLSGKEYIDFVKPLVEKSVKEITGECVIVPSRDEDVRLAKELGVPLAREKVNAVGGVVVKSKDGRVSVDNTFEGILKRKEKEIRVRLGTMLFGD